MPVPLATPLATRTPSKKLKIIRALNIITIILVFSAHSYAAYSIAIDSSYEPHTYLTPSLIFLGILLSVLYILQFGYAFYGQFYNKTRIVQNIVEKVIGYLFVLSNLFMLGWLIFWVSYKSIFDDIVINMILS